MRDLVLRLAPAYSVFFSKEFKTEVIRKSLHLLIALVPLLASINIKFTMMLLGVGTLFYVFVESARIKGIPVFIISDLTIIASRDNDRGRFVLGPVTLGIGAMLSLLLYPTEASTIAIYALAFGDSIASLVGKTIGKLRLPFSGGKTIAGSIACFIVILIFSYYFTGNLKVAFYISFTAMVLEALPITDMDNIIMPVGTGFVAALIIPLM